MKIKTKTKKISKIKKSKKPIKVISKKEKNSRSLGSKLVITFSLVILLVLLVVGYSVNNKASSILRENYQIDSQILVDETTNRIDEYFKKFEAVLNIYASNPNVRKAETSPIFKSLLYELMNNILNSEKDILAIKYSSFKGDVVYFPGEESYNDITIKEEVWYQNAVDANGEIAWSSPYYDEKSGEVIMTGSKAVVDITGKVSNVVAVDLEVKTIANMLNEIQFGQKGYPILLDKDFSILTHKSEELIGVILPVSEIIDLIKSGEKKPVAYKWEENGVLVNKFAVYGVSKVNGLYILATIYDDEIEEQTKSILYFIAFIGVIALIFSIIVAIIFSKTITKSIKTLLDSMSLVKDGDMTADVNVKSNDEVGMLGEYFGDTVYSLNRILLNVKAVSDELSESAQKLAATSQENTASADEVSRTVEEIAKGAADQALDAEKSATISQDLSMKVMDLNGNTEKLLVSTKEVLDANLNGVKAIEVLRDKTAVSETANEEIEIVVNELNNKTQNISNILDAISNISKQTNLLALNASIEAARAGEHGRGFAVVADEIRKLAIESSKSAEEIRDIVTNIQVDSKKTVSSMIDLKKISSEQSDAVLVVGNAFGSISTSLEEMSLRIDGIGSSVNELEVDKEKIVNSIENISAVSEETASAAEEVNAAMDQQIYAEEEVAKAAKTLNEISVQLKEELSNFKLK